MSIPKYIEANFNQLLIAVGLGDACVLECLRNSDGKVVTLICAITHKNGKASGFVPFAEMIEGNPFELYSPPMPGKDGEFVLPAVELENVDTPEILYPSKPEILTKEKESGPTKCYACGWYGTHSPHCTHKGPVMVNQFARVVYVNSSHGTLIVNNETGIVVSATQECDCAERDIDCPINTYSFDLAEFVAHYELENLDNFTSVDILDLGGTMMNGQVFPADEQFRADLKAQKEQDNEEYAN